MDGQIAGVAATTTPTQFRGHLRYSDEYHRARNLRNGEYIATNNWRFSPNSPTRRVVLQTTGLNVDGSPNAVSESEFDVRGFTPEESKWAYAEASREFDENNKDGIDPSSGAAHATRAKLMLEKLASLRGDTMKMATPSALNGPGNPRIKTADASAFAGPDFPRAQPFSSPVVSTGPPPRPRPARRVDFQIGDSGSWYPAAYHDVVVQTAMDGSPFAVLLIDGGGPDDVPAFLPGDADLSLISIDDCVLDVAPTGLIIDRNGERIICLAVKGVVSVPGG